MKITGWAAVFNSRSVDLGGFVEMIEPGAFSQTLKSGDVRLLINHDGNGLPLARTKSGTLRLHEDRRGLKFDAVLPDTEAGRSAWEAVRRGDVDGMSFGFNVIRDSWQQAGGEVLRTLREVSLAEVSLVGWPAYPGTTAVAVPQQAEAQRATPQADPLDLQWRRLRVAKARCN
jgi:HK97 family phage prohead protease